MTWGELSSLLRLYVHRSDVQAVLAAFLPMVEQRIYVGEANTPALRVAAMLQSVTMADGTRPTGFLQAKRVMPAAGLALNFRPLERIEHECRAFTWNGSTMVLSPDAGGFPVTMTYYGRFAALDPNDANSTNWLLTEAPGLYVNSFLVEIGTWSRDEAMTARSAANYTSAAEALTQADKMAQISGAPIVAQVIQ